MNSPSPGHEPLFLLVEDEQDAADLVTLIMKERGYQVSQAHNRDEPAIRTERFRALEDPLTPYASEVPEAS